MLILKMNFARLIVHEMAQVALRATTMDFNMSTSELINRNNSSHAYAILEAGAIADKKLFKIRVT